MVGEKIKEGYLIEGQAKGKIGWKYRPTLIKNYYFILWHFSIN